MSERVLDYLRLNFTDPGTMRSLIWVCLSAAGLDRGETEVTHYALVASLGLGLLSALLPPRKP
jgi:hypothetical protein